MYEEQEAAQRRVVESFAAALKAAGCTGRPAADEALARAVLEEDVEAAEAAIAAGASPQVRVRVQNGHTTSSPVAIAASGNNLRMLRLLIQAGADPDVGERDRAPLAGPALRGLTEVVRVLLEAGADPDGLEGADAYDRPLSAARMNGHRDVIELLEAAGGTEAPKTRGFKPGVDLGNALTEMVVRADGAVVAQAVRDALGGRVHADVLDSEVVAADAVGALVVQLKGSGWSNVIGHVGFERIPDERWRALADAVSGALAVPCILVCYEDVSGSHGYWVHEGGQEVEVYGDHGVWRTERNTPVPEDPEDGVGTIQALAEREGFALFESNPGGSVGKPFLFAFPGDRRPLLGGWYRRGRVNKAGDEGSGRLSGRWRLLLPGMPAGTRNPPLPRVDPTVC